MMAKRSTIPFGPQHPVLPEPIHLDLVLEDEVVVEAIPNIGFVHRGLEKLVETRDFKQYGLCGRTRLRHLQLRTRPGLLPEHRTDDGHPGPPAERHICAPCGWR